MSCGCISPVPEFRVPPPPDFSLVWDLYAEGEYQHFDDCVWSPLLSFDDVTAGISPQGLIPVALGSLALLLLLVIMLVVRIRRRRDRLLSSKTTSSDAILVSGDNVWTYNSMKTSPNGVIMGSQSGSRVFHQTPATLRSYVSVERGSGVRYAPDAAYLTLRQSSNGFYEEIPPRGSPQLYFPPPPMSPEVFRSQQKADGRYSLRKPPPTCRPPPPPVQTSPSSSELSIEREITRINHDSPPNGWEGRESGYGTAPSRQWRSPGSGGRPEDTRVPYVLTQAPAHSMTYV